MLKYSDFPKYRNNKTSSFVFAETRDWQVFLVALFRGVQSYQEKAIVGADSNKAEITTESTESSNDRTSQIRYGFWLLDWNENLQPTDPIANKIGQTINI